MPLYRSLDYADNYRLLIGMGYKYLTFFTEKAIANDDLKDEPGYENTLFREAIPTVKPQEDDGITVDCFPIDFEECIIMLDSDRYSFGVAERYFIPPLL